MFTELFYGEYIIFAGNVRLQMESGLKMIFIGYGVFNNGSSGTILKTPFSIFISAFLVKLTIKKACLLDETFLFSILKLTSSCDKYILNVVKK
jgi:hypothetical protein